MDIKYNDKSDEAIVKNIDRITNQIFKLLPNRRRVMIANSFTI